MRQKVPVQRRVWGQYVDVIGALNAILRPLRSQGASITDGGRGISRSAWDVPCCNNGKIAVFAQGIDCGAIINRPPAPNLQPDCRFQPCGGGPEFARANSAVHYPDTGDPVSPVAKGNALPAQVRKFLISGDVGLNAIGHAIFGNTSTS
jgi:hypothetical protein